MRKNTLITLLLILISAFVVSGMFWISNPFTEVSPLAIYRMEAKDRGGIIYNPKLGEIVLNPGEKFSWSWNMKESLNKGVVITPGKYAAGLDYNDLDFWIEGGEGVHTVQIGVFSLKPPFTEFTVTNQHY